MKQLIDSRLILAAGILGLSACSTPQPVREGAQFSAAQLAVFQSELQGYAASSNANIEKQTAIMIEQFKDRLTLERETEDTLYFTTGKTELSNELVILAKRYESREDDAERLIKPELARLGGLTQPIKFSSESFVKAMKALAELGDEEDIEEQLAFIASYVQDVQKSIKAEEKKALALEKEKAKEKNEKEGEPTAAK